MKRAGAFLLGVWVATGAGAQCIPAWHPRGAGPWLTEEVLAVAAWDPDGTGPQTPVVIAGGNFQTPYPSVALWDGTHWQSMAGGASGGRVIAITLHDPDGSGAFGEMPVIGGRFQTAGGVPANRVAWWDGAAWHPFGAGIGTQSQFVDGLASYQGDLIAAGSFNTAGGQPSAGLARWDGTAWHDFSQIMSNGPDALMVRGDYLYAEGRLPDGQFGVRRYRNGTWEVLGGQFQGHEVGGTGR